MFDATCMEPPALNFRMERRSKVISNGTIEKAVCPLCGERLVNPRMIAEEVIRSVRDGQVDGAQRIFLGECPTHGIRRVDHMGHHTTAYAKVHAKRYAAARRKIARALSGMEKKRFSDALRGRWIPSDDELGRWDRIRDAEGDI